MKNFYPLKLFVVLFLVTINFSIKAQFPNPVSFNTAVNAGLNGTVPPGANDLSWTASTVSINGPYVPAVKVNNQSSWLTSPYNTADWITYPHACNFNLSDHSCLGSVDEYFRLIFTLPTGVCNGTVNSSGGYCLSMNYFADNCVNEIFINGVMSYSNLASSYTANNFQATGGATVTLCDNWHPGTNTLVVHVQSGVPKLGFLAFTTDSITPQNQFTISATKSNVSCYGGNNGAVGINLFGYSGTPSYTWLPGGSNSQNVSNLSAGVYSVNIQFPLCNYTSTISVTQPASFAVNVSTAQAVCPGTNVTFTATGGLTYSWSPGNLSGSIVTLSATSTKDYTVTVVDSLGCAISKVFKLQVLNCSGIEEATLNGMEVRNNLLGDLIVSTSNNEECRAEIFDLIGNLKCTWVHIKNSEINLSNLPAGIYFLKITSTTTFLKKRIIIGM